MAAHQGFVMCQKFDPAQLAVPLLLLALRGYSSQSELHKGRLCLIFMLDCICYFSAISSPWCFLLQASGLMVSSGSPRASR